MHSTPTASSSGTLSLGNELLVNRLGFGAMRITGKGVWGPPSHPDIARQVLQRAIELEVNFIDTADSYGPFVSENLIAEALHPYPAGLVIGTKGGLTRPGPDQWTVNGRPEHLEAALKGSLKRLKVEQIDLYQLHRIDNKVPADETLGMLKELHDQEYFRLFGLSEVSVAQIEMASAFLPVTSVQNRYSLTYRIHDEVLDYCTDKEIAFIPWYPLDAGVLEDPTLLKIAREQKATVYQIAIAWLLAKSDVMLPIPGTGSVDHLMENVAAATIELSTQDMDQLEELSAS